MTLAGERPEPPQEVDMNGQSCPTEGISKLLIATEGSESSRSAVSEAIEFARMCSSKLIILSEVLSNSEYEDGVPWAIDQVEREIRNNLEAIKKTAYESGIECEIIVLRGHDPSMDIVGEAVTNKVDMIVMGTHGRSGLKRLVMGSVAGEVLRHARCKVLVVPPGAKIDYSRILLVTDGSIHGSVAASEALAVATRSNGSLTVVSVASSKAQFPEMEANVEQVLKFAEKHGVKAEGTTLRGKPEEAIAHLAEQKGAGLIVLGGYRANEGLNLPMGSVTERIIAGARKAVLVVKAG